MGQIFPLPRGKPIKGDRLPYSVFIAQSTLLLLLIIKLFPPTNQSLLRQILRVNGLGDIPFDNPIIFFLTFVLPFLQQLHMALVQLFTRKLIHTPLFYQ